MEAKQRVTAFRWEHPDSLVPLVKVVENPVKQEGEEDEEEMDTNKSDDDDDEEEDSKSESKSSSCCSSLLFSLAAFTGLSSWLRVAQVTERILLDRINSQNRNGKDFIFYRKYFL